MKVMLISSINYAKLKSQINDFIQGRDLIDIKYSTCFDGQGINYSVLIMYKE